jgi:hypothetical protein
MENITCAAELKLAIREKQFQQKIQYELLKEELYITYESLKSVSWMKSKLEEITSSSYLIDNMFGGITGLLSGYLSKKIAVGTSHNVFRKVIGSVLQFGITNFVTQHPEILRNLGQLMIEKIIHKTKET